MEDKRQKILDNVWIRTIIITVLGASFLGLCIFLKEILVSLLLAFIIAYVFDPIVDFIESRKRIFPSLKVSRTFAIIILLMGITLTSYGFLTYAIPKTINGAQQLRTTLKQYHIDIKQYMEDNSDNAILLFFNNQRGIDNLSKNQPENKEHTEDWEIVNEGEGLNIDSNKTKTINRNDNDAKTHTHNIPAIKRLQEYSPEAVKFISNIFNKVFHSTFGLLGNLIDFFIFSVVTVYLLKDFTKIISSARDLIPLSRREKSIIIFSKIDINLKDFFRGQITVSFILFSIYSICLTIAGIPLSFVLGMVAGFGNMIPYVGTIWGLVFALIITFLHFHDIQHIIIVLAVFGFVQMLDSAIITPKIIGHKIGISPVVIIISILVLGELLGTLGLLLAVPFIATVKVFIEEGVIKYKESHMYKKLPK